MNETSPDSNAGKSATPAGLRPGIGEARDLRELQDLRALITGFRWTIHVLALCGIVIAGSFFLYMQRQVEGVQRQSAELSRYLTDYQINFIPQFEAARSNLFVFAKDNPTVTPVLAKYFTNAPGATRRP